MIETNSSLYISLLNNLKQRCNAVLRSSDVQSGCISLFTMLHYLLTSVTKSERLLALEIFLSYDMCIWRKLFQFTIFFFWCWQMLYWLFFLYILRAFTIFVSCTIFHPFFRYHFLKQNPIIHNVYCLNRFSRLRSKKTSLYHHTFIVKDIYDLLPVHCI